MYSLVLACCLLGGDAASSSLCGWWCVLFLVLLSPPPSWSGAALSGAALPQSSLEWCCFALLDVLLDPAFPSCFRGGADFLLLIVGGGLTQNDNFN